MERDHYILFCNEGYGREFERAFREWCARHGVRDALVVRSGRDETPRRTLGGALEKVLRHVKGSRGGIDLLRVDDVNGPEFHETVLAPGARHVGIVAGFNQIFRKGTIARFATLCNFHPSLLPYYRGPAPSYWCLRNGETRTGLTLHHVTERVDSGEILWQKDLAIEGTDPDEVDRSLSALGAAVLPDLLESLRTGSPFPVKRVDAAAVYTHHVDYRSFPGTG